VDVYVSANIYNVTTHERQQRIIPGIHFTCTGMLTKWIIGAQRTLTQTTNHPQLQIWSRRSPTSNTFDRISFNNLIDLNATDDLNVYEYTPNPPLQFQADDLLVVVYLQEGGGPQSYRCNQNSALSSFTTSSGGVLTDTDIPLVAVEVSGKPYIPITKLCMLFHSQVNCPYSFRR